MNFDDLINEAENPKYIEGIYNYCDRWCERCVFTRQCLNFSMNDNSKEINHITNEKFWENLSQLLEDTMNFLSEKADQEGFDLKFFENDLQDADKINDKIDEYESVIIAKHYTEYTHQWMKKNKTFIAEYEHSLYNSETFDPFEVIGWYHTQIFVKLKRAYLSKSLGADIENMPKDSDGSAKVVLIAIDRSLASWGELATNTEINDNDVLNFLILLDKIKKLVELDFPNARAFVRPGFDLMN